MIDYLFKTNLTCNILCQSRDLNPLSSFLSCTSESISFKECIALVGVQILSIIVFTTFLSSLINMQGAYGSNPFPRGHILRIIFLSLRYYLLLRLSFCPVMCCHILTATFLKQCIGSKKDDWLEDAPNKVMHRMHLVLSFVEPVFFLHLSITLTNCMLSFWEVLALHLSHALDGPWEGTLCGLCKPSSSYYYYIKNPNKDHILDMHDVWQQHTCSHLHTLDNHA